jgi:polyhydroxyalkanoate synthase
VSPRAQVLTALTDPVPGALLNMLSLSAAPESFVGFRWLDALNSLHDPETLRRHLLVTRWTLDEALVAGRLFEEIVEWLYRENRFMGGNLKIDGKKATPSQVVAPLLSVVDRDCNIVPPEAVLRFHGAMGSTDQEVLWYRSDAGVALRHVGPLVGKSAHRDHGHA